MATEPSPVHDEIEVFQQMEDYPWDKDAEFQGGLAAILGPNPTAQSPTELTELTLRAQCFYLSRKRNISIDFEAYKNYLSSNPSLQTNQNPNDKPPTSSNTAQPPEPPPHSSNPISFPPSAPVNSTDSPSHTNLAATGSQTACLPSKTAPYPSTFSEIVALITSGTPIPGIREIPDTLLTGQATKAAANKRRKPWEKDVPDTTGGECGGGTFGDERDAVIAQELPQGI